jgi:hypothetical protein
MISSLKIKLNCSYKFSSRSSEALGSSWLPASAPADRWLRCWHQWQLVNQHLRSGHQKKFKRNWEVPLVSLERSWWGGLMEFIWFILFCSYEIHWTRMLQIMFFLCLESSWWGGVHGLGSMAVQKCLNIEWFLHWKLN